MPHSTHTYRADADAPLDRIEVGFRYHPPVKATSAASYYGGEPGAPASVDILSVRVEVDGAWHDAPDWLAERIARDQDDNIIATAEQERDEDRAFGRAA